MNLNLIFLKAIRLILGMHPLVRFSRPGPANFQRAQPDVIPALHTGQELRVIYHAHKSLKFCLLLVNGAPGVVELPLV